MCIQQRERALGTTTPLTTSQRGRKHGKDGHSGRQEMGNKERKLAKVENRHPKPWPFTSLQKNGTEQMTGREMRDTPHWSYYYSIIISMTAWLQPCTQILHKHSERKRTPAECKFHPTQHILNCTRDSPGMVVKGKQAKRNAGWGKGRGRERERGNRVCTEHMILLIATSSKKITKVCPHFCYKATLHSS